MGVYTIKQYDIIFKKNFMFGIFLNLGYSKAQFAEKADAWYICFFIRYLKLRKKLAFELIFLFNIVPHYLKIYKVCPSSKNRHKIALKNGMNLNNSFPFAKTSAFIPRFTWQRASADMIFRRKGEAAPRAVRPGTSLSYRLLIVKRLSRHKRSVNARTLSEIAN